MNQSRWVDIVINNSTQDASSSWWLNHRSRADFDKAVAAEQLRMSRSKFGRPTVSTDKGYGDGE